MTDFFALLDEARAAAIDVNALKQKFHQRARNEHPDVADGAGFEKLNAAYRTLADPKLRLAHLLELNGATTAHIDQPPADLVDLFFATSVALNQAQRGDRTAAEMQLRNIGKLRAATVASLSEINVNDVAAARGAHQRLSFYDRWIEQLLEATVRA